VVSKIVKKAPILERAGTKTAWRHKEIRETRGKLSGVDSFPRGPAETHELRANNFLLLSADTVLTILTILLRLPISSRRPQMKQ